MKKKPIEADLDPADAPPRPGSKIADSAIANSKPKKPKPTRNSGPSRPGAGAAARAVAESKRKGGKDR